MNTDPVAFVRDDFVRLFNTGVAAYKARGEGGDEKAKARYADIASARGKVLVRFEGDGGGTLWLSVKDGVMTLTSGLVMEPPGAAEPPEQPTFSATVSWDDIEDVRAGELTAQQLFGRLRIAGDATQAMALGMTLMQRRQQAR